MPSCFLNVDSYFKHVVNNLEFLGTIEMLEIIFILFIISSSILIIH